MGNKLNHGRKLAAMVTEIKFSTDDRSRSRAGRNGETHTSYHHKRLVKRYNKMTRAASKRQLRRYTE